MKKIGWIYAGLVLVAVGCEAPIDNRKLLDELVVTTNYDPEADFGEYATYAIPTDTIGFSTNTDPNDTIIIQSENNYPRPVLDAIRANLEDRGYTRVDRTANPDLGINVTLVNDYSVFQQVTYPGGYYGGYYSGYYGYGSYYSYPYVNTYAYNTGVLIIEIIDLKNPIQNKVKVIWSSYMGDIYSANDGGDLILQSEKGVDQSFIQSPYIQK